MSILPKVYRFIYVTEDKRPNTCWVVARNTENAVKWFRNAAQDYPDSLPEQFCYMRESLLANIAALLLPKFKYVPKTKWTIWEIL